MRLNPGFFKVPSWDATPSTPKDPVAKRGPRKSRGREKGKDKGRGRGGRKGRREARRQERAPPPVLGMLVNVGRPAGSETRRISPNLTVTVISNSMRDNALRREDARDQEDEDASSPTPSPSQEEGRDGACDKVPGDFREDVREGTHVDVQQDAHDNAHEDAHVDAHQDAHQDPHKDAHQDANKDAPGRASPTPSVGARSRASVSTSGTVSWSWGEGDSRTTLSDLTEPHSWPTADAAPEEGGWRDRMCGLPECGAWDGGFGEEEEAWSFESASGAGEESAGCFALG